MFEPEYTQYLKTGRMDGPEIEALQLTGVRRLLERGDGEEVTFEDPVIGNKVVGVDKEYALGIAITKRTVEDDKYRKANQAAKWLARATRLTYEYRAAALLDDAFAGATFTGLDGLAMCHTAHTLLNPGSGATTTQNRPTTEVGFGLTGINALLDLSELMKDENGDPSPMKVDTVIYNPTQKSKAIQIFGSDLEPFTADNQDNAVKKRLPTIKHVVKRYTTNTTSYHLVDSRLNDAWVLTRRPVEFSDDFDFKTSAAMYMAAVRFLIWFADHRGWLGSNPS